MLDYFPLDLSRFANAGAKVLGKPHARIPAGRQTWHGIPFLLKARAGKCVVALGRGLSNKAVEIPIQRMAQHVLFAHRLLETKIPQGEPVGKWIAEYVLRFADGSEERLPIRERLEIGVIPPEWGQWCILAWPDRKDGLIARHEGPFEGTGRRQTEATQAFPQDFYLWAWSNPRPELRIESLIVCPTGPRFYLGAVTLSNLAEFPFNRSAKRTVKIVLPNKKDADAPFDLSVEVDRGVANYPYPLSRAKPTAYLQDNLKGWGEVRNAKASPAYVEIAARPSAKITVKQGKKKLGTATWGDLEKKKRVKPTPRLELILVEDGRNWVSTTVLDDETGKAVPCRVHFRSIDGVPYQPHGHPSHVFSNMGTWHIDVGGDVRLGNLSYAYIDGRCEGWLPRGEVIVDIARGFEYEPVRQKITIQPGQQDLHFRLKRNKNLNKERYFSGDTHVHFLSTQGSHLEAAGEGLNVVNLLLSQWGHLFTNTEEFTGQPSVSPDGQTIVYATQENRQHILGHLTLLGLKTPVNPWCTDGPSEAELGGSLECTLSHWADACHAQGGTVIIPHLPNPNCEPAALIATGRADAVEMLVQSEYKHLEYYRYLNCGYKLPLTGGTDKMSSDVPVGLYRTYVHIPEDEPFTYDNWCKYLKGGNTFLSGGPLLWFKVEGQPIGSTINLPGNGGTVEAEIRAESVLPMQALELVMNGQVVARTETAQPTRVLQLKERLRVEKHAWICARCSGPKYFNSVKHHDGWGRGIMAHTSPVYLAVGEPWWMFDADTANYMLTLLGAGIEYIHRRSPQYKPGTVTHHHGGDDHLKFLETPFRQAIAAVHRRMHQLNIPH